MTWDAVGYQGRGRSYRRDRRHRASSPVIGKGRTLPRMTRIRKDRKTPETVPFKMPIAPIKVKESSKRKYVSRILRAGTCAAILRGAAYLGSRLKSDEIISRDSSRARGHL